MLKIGQAYKIGNDRRFPFDCPYGVYVGESLGEFSLFEYGNKKLAMNGGEYKEYNPNEPTEPEFLYVASEVTHNGETLYKRIPKP